MKFLIVDDHALIRDAMCAVLRELRPDSTVLEAPDAAAAPATRGAQPDVDSVPLDLPCRRLELSGKFLHRGGDAAARSDLQLGGLCIEHRQCHQGQTQKELAGNVRSWLGPMDARRDDSGLAVRRLWGGPSDRYGSGAAHHVVKQQSFGPAGPDGDDV